MNCNLYAIYFSLNMIWSYTIGQSFIVYIVFNQWGCYSIIKYQNRLVSIIDN